MDSLEEYRSRKAAIETRIAALKKEAAPEAKPANPATFTAAHPQELSRLVDRDTTPADRNRILRGFVRQIVFDRRANAFTIQYYA